MEQEYVISADEFDTAEEDESVRNEDVMEVSLHMKSNYFIKLFTQFMQTKI